MALPLVKLVINFVAFAEIEQVELAVLVIQAINWSSMILPEQDIQERSYLLSPFSFEQAR